MLTQAIFLILLNTAPVVRAEGPGTTGAATLTSPTGARPASLAGAFTAASETLDALGYNPAGLAELQAPTLASWNSHRLGLGMLTASFAGAVPTRAGTFALALITFDAGSVELIDLDGNSRDVSAQKDFVYIASYANTIRPLRLSLGGNLKRFESRLAEAASAGALVADFRAQYPIAEGWRVGAAIQNVGNSIKYLEIADPPPTRIRGGIQSSRSTPLGRMNLYADLIRHKHEGFTTAAIGVEQTLNQYASVRIGYKAGLDGGSGEAEKLNFGLGTTLGRLSLDFGMSMAEGLEDALNFTVKWRFQ